MSRDYNGFSGSLRDRSSPWLRRQYALGVVARPTECEVCFQTHGAIGHHAEDYAEPFGPHIYEYRLCYRCHMVLHCRFGSEQRTAGWNRYRAEVRAGYRFPPLGWNDIRRVFEMFSGRWPEGVLVNPLRDETLLDRIEAGGLVPSKLRPVSSLTLF